MEQVYLILLLGKLFAFSSSELFVSGYNCCDCYFLEVHADCS